jgi:hypothetical protein
MARIRTIKPEFWEDEKLGRLCDLDRLNFLGLISLADDEGRGRGSAEWLCHRLHPYSVNGHIKVMAQSLARLETINVVRLYEIDGQHFYQLRNFKRHQRINRPTESRLPSLPEPSVNTHGILIEPSPREGSLRESERNGSGAETIGSPGEGAASSALAPAAPPKKGAELTEALRAKAKKALGISPDQREAAAVGKNLG